ncbi:ThiF family adenylyltransferase [Paenirhodobacter enshiensis]|uniref:ThiF family adenylyltransferase n=1 Tax=Paenirhodobacter enshiensis TaxID=1105367 RepID=UPI0035B278B9
MTRYDRQTVLPEVGAEGQRRLAAARVLVVGAGGLGSTVLPLLAGAGVGSLRIVDPDTVEETNLHRQTLYEMADIGRPKAGVAAEALRRRNPEIAVSALIARLDPVLARAEVAAADLVIDAADSFAVSYALSDVCEAQGKPLITASVSGRQGYAGGFCAGAPGLRALFPDLPMQAPDCSGGGVMGPAVAMLGALQAQMALSVLLGHRPPALGQMLRLDLASWHVSGFRFDTAPAPDDPGPEVLALSEIAADDLVVDLRHDTAAPDPAPVQRVVFLCRTGLRAWRAARALQATGHARVAIVGDGE